MLENSIAFTHPKWHDKSFRNKFLAACRRLLKNWFLTAGMSPYSLLFMYGRGLAIFAMFTVKDDPPFYHSIQHKSFPNVDQPKPTAERSNQQPKRILRNNQLFFIFKNITRSIPWYHTTIEFWKSIQLIGRLGISYIERISKIRATLFSVINYLVEN